MKKTSFKLIAVLLSVCILVLSLPISVIAQTISELVETDEPEISIDTSTAQVEDTTELVDDEKVFEVTELREESAKHFRLDDGTYIAAQYDTPVHYLDENGRWQDIDNTLYENGVDISTYDAKIKFAKKITGNESLFTLHDGNHKITWGLDGAIKKTVGVAINTQTECDESATTLQKMMTLDKLSSKVLYANILKGVDLEYIVGSNNIKENIIVKEKKDSYSYTFSMKLNNLTAQMGAEGSVLITDSSSGELKYTIPAPIAYDANNTFAPSDKVNYTLTSSGNGKYSLTVTVDVNWMNSEERAFPVVVDPIINASIPSNNMTDTYVDSSHPTISYYSNTNYLAVGQGNAGQNFIAYWMLNPITKIPSSAYVVSAKLNLYCNSFENHSTEDTELQLGAYQVTSDWSAGLTWNSMANEGVGAVSSLVDYATLTSSSQGKKVSWDITSLARKWVSGSVDNYGIAIKQMRNSDIDALFSSKEGNSMPQFVVQYKDMKGLESYWTYSSHNIGFAGSGNINLATGQLILTKPLLSTTDSLMPYTPTLIYDSSMAGVDFKYPNAETSYSETYEPVGFKLNIHETIIQKYYYTESGSRRYTYVLSDADGTEHYFLPVRGEDGTYSTTEYQDEDGLQLVLNVIGDIVTITDNAQNVRTYSKLSTTPNSNVLGGWYLSSIADAYGNKIVFRFDAENRPNLVSLLPNEATQQIEFLKIGYNSENRPNIIWNQTAKEALVLRYSSTPTGAITTTNEKYLRTIEYIKLTSSGILSDLQNYYSDSNNEENITVAATATYTYDSNGRLISAKDNLSRYEMQYTLYGDGTVRYVAEYDASGNMGQKLAFSYNASYAQVRTSGADDIYANSDDIYTRYVFDGEGRVISCYSMDLSNNLLGSTSAEYETQDDIKNNIKPTVSLSASPTNYLMNGGFDDSTVFRYWSVTSNVKRVMTSNINYFHTYEYEAQIDVKPNATDTLIQYTRIPAGKYTLSMDIKATECENVRVYMKAEALADPTRVYEKEIPVYRLVGGIEDSTVSMQIEAQNVLSNGGENIRITIRIVGGASVSGYANVCIDNVVLGSGIGNDYYNLVQMGEFDNLSINSSGNIVSTYESWWAVNSGNWIIGETNPPFKKGWYAPASPCNEKHLTQTVYSCDSTMINQYDEGVTRSYMSAEYIVSGYAKATAAVPNGEFRIRVQITYYAGNNSSFSDYYDLCFVDDCTMWQFASGSFRTRSGYLVRSIKIICDYSNQATGDAMFDNIALVRMDSNEVSEIEYYDGGKASGLVKTKTQWGFSEYYEYNDKRQITLYANSNGEMSEYSYDEDGITLNTQWDYTFDCGYNHPLRFWEYEEKPAINQTLTRLTTYVYNNYGQPYLIHTIDKQSESNSNIYRRLYSYDIVSTSKTFGALLSESDISTETHYYYDASNGRLLMVVNPKSKTGVYYEYDAIGNIISVMPATYTYSYVPVTEEEKVEYTYNELNQLDKITTNSTVYSFSYDSFGAMSDISIGNNEIASYEYQASNGKISKINYANGVTLRYVYTYLDNIKEIWYNTGGEETLLYEYEYTKYGQLSRYNDNYSGTSTIYSYDTSGRMINYSVFDSDKLVNTFTKDIAYDNISRIDYVNYTFDYYGSNNTIYEDSLMNGYYYDKEGRIYSWDVLGYGVSVNGSYTYDGLNRVSSIEIDADEFVNEVDYSYYNATDTITSTRVEAYQSKINGDVTSSYTYSYDDKNNITKIIDADGNEIRYAYDEMGQLIREDNELLRKTYMYTYDKSGNLLSKKIYPVASADVTPLDTPIITKSYPYTYGNENWGDQLTKYNDVSLTYDAVGNPLRYYNGIVYTMQWQNGRQLASLSRGESVLLFGYNADGVRISKTVNGVEHKYQVDGTTIISESYQDCLLVYLYDATGSPIGFKFRKTSYAEGVFDTYWFEKNLQGDVIAVYSESGLKLVKYIYDAWGNCTEEYLNGGAGTIVAQNPFRYRGYYWDKVSGFYYLNSRYYDPVIGRFINADGYISTGQGILGNNMYAYCGNNPVMLNDPTGMFWEEILDFFEELINDIGFALNFNKENEGDSTYLGVVTVENGSGYNKAFESDKPINFNVTNEDVGWKIWELSGGIDINYDGFGASINLYGPQKSISIHYGKGSFELGANAAGRIFYKNTYEENGVYAYEKISLNGPEIVGIVLVCYYFPALVSTLIPVAQKAITAIGN